MKKLYLKTTTDEYELEIDQNSGIIDEITQNLPFEGEGKNIGGEIFFNITIDIPFNGMEQEIIDIGDVVYWRSLKEDKFAIAIFYGNTKFGDGTKSRAFSPCIKFAEIKFEISRLKNFETGNIIKIISK